MSLESYFNKRTIFSLDGNKGEVVPPMKVYFLFEFEGKFQRHTPNATG